MKLLVTGADGTLGSKLVASAQAQGHDVIGWDRQTVSPDDATAGAAFVDRVAPDAIVHLALGSEAWAGRLAQLAGTRPFVHISSTMVFDAEPDGPHAPDDVRTAKDDYGRYKIRCEDAVRAASGTATVARIGWQIDPRQPGNNMLFALDEWQARDGCVRASRAWRTSCSFMDDTVAALLDLTARPQSGIVHLDSNATAGHSFGAIVAALKAQFGRDHWRIEVDDNYRHDQRLVGGPVALPPLAQRLPALAD